MANVHIALVGGQTYPVYLGIAETSPDRVILVHSLDSLVEARRIAAEFDGTDLAFDYEEFDPVNVTQVFEKANALAQSLGDDHHYTINLTSGTKVWSILFRETFASKPDVKFIYVDQSCSIYDLSSGEVKETEMVEMDRVFRLNNTSVLKSMDFHRLTEEDLNAIPVIRYLYLSKRFAFTALTVPTTRPGENKIRNNKDSFVFQGSSISWDHETKTIDFQLKTKTGMIEKTLSSPHIFDLVFFAGWFEAEVSRHLSMWKHSHEVKMNVQFPYVDGKTKNEIDVIVNTGKRLLFVECKTHIHNLTDLDKFSKAVRNYGGMGCHALFVTFESLSQLAEEKCRDNGIIPFSFKDALDACHEDDKSGVITNALHQLLDEQLFTINKK